MMFSKILKSFKSKSKSDFCEGCSYLGLYNQKTQDCVICNSQSSLSHEITAEKFQNSDFTSEILGHYKHTTGFSSAEYTERSSAGGLASALLKSLLENNIVDYVLGVGYIPSQNKFGYIKIEKTEDLKKVQRSAYYPINLKDALDIIKSSDGVCAITAIPSAATAIENLKTNDTELKEKVKYTVGLVSGHMKTKDYTEYMCNKADKIDGSKNCNYISYRDKLEDSNYSGGGYYFVAKTDDKTYSIKANKILLNWQAGLFKEFSSDFCEDTFAKSADITIMDGWLKKFRNEKGVSLAIVRNPQLSKTITDLNGKHFEISPKEIIASQAGGLRNKTIGLSIRLWLFTKVFKKEIPRKNTPIKIFFSPVMVVKNTLIVYTAELSKQLYAKRRKSSDVDKGMRFTNLLLMIISAYQKLVRKIFSK
jgi:coenzyme F420 hydrogenase subunit beta